MKISLQITQVRKKKLQMGLTLYYAPASTACRATLLTLMSLNITFNTRIVNLRAKEQMKPDFLQVCNIFFYPNEFYSEV